VSKRWIFCAFLVLALTSCGPDRVDLQLRVNKVQRSLSRQVEPSEATLTGAIHDCSLLIGSEINNKNPLGESATGGGLSGRQADIFHYRHLAAVFLANLPPERQSAVAMANPMSFPNYDPARHDATAFEYLQDDSD
jgi:hypothetical protein